MKNSIPNKELKNPISSMGKSRYPWVLKMWFPLITIMTSLILGGQTVMSGDVVINEIMYRAPDDLNELEYVELWNSGNESVEMGGWRVKGIGLKIEPGTTLKPDEYFVACRNADLFERIYQFKPNAVFKKSLNNGGELLTLIDAAGDIMESVEYDDQSPWHDTADGKSASLERISPLHDANLPHNWAPSNLTSTFTEQPSGSPGKINSIYQKALPPVLTHHAKFPAIVSAGSELKFSVDVQGEVNQVEVLVNIINPGHSTEEMSIKMERVGDSQFHASIPGQDKNRVIRYRFKAIGKNKSVSWLPHPNALRPTFSSYVPGDLPSSEISIMHFISADESIATNFENYRTQSGRRFGRGGFGFGPPPEESAEELLRRELFRRASDEALKSEFARLTLDQKMTTAKIADLANAFRVANQKLNTIRDEIRQAGNVASMKETFDLQMKQMVSELTSSCRAHLSGEQINNLSESLLSSKVDERRQRGFDPNRLVQAIFDIESMWFQHVILQEPEKNQFSSLYQIFSKALNQRQGILDGLVQQKSEPDLPSILAKVRQASTNLNDNVREILGEPVPEEVADRDGIQERRGREERFGRGPGDRFGRGNVSTPVPPQGQSALVYRAEGSDLIQFFDHVNILPRKSGYKVRLHKDNPLNGMTTLNVLFEPGDASTINEMLAYPTYDLFGNVTVNSGATRVLMNGEVAGYHLWFEQPNGTFLKRNGWNSNGNFYKVIWQQSNRPSPFIPQDQQTERNDIVARWEKVTHPHEGYGDLVNLIESLEGAKGDAAAMWRVIESHFDVDQVINYYATNLLLSHWDGFFNNYFLYHDVKETGKWSILPWDQDSTWSLRGGSPDSLAKMPLNYGGEGARPPGASEQRQDRSPFGGRGFGGFGGFRGGFGWWRDGDIISKSLIGNPTFFEKYKLRIKSLLENKFTSEIYEPLFADLKVKLTPEVKLRAEINNLNPEEETQRFHDLFDILNQHLEYRREFLLAELEK